jgi:hypothetical protein
LKSARFAVLNAPPLDTLTEASWLAWLSITAANQYCDEPSLRRTEIGAGVRGFGTVL